MTWSSIKTMRKLSPNRMSQNPFGETRAQKHPWFPISFDHSLKCNRPERSIQRRTSFLRLLVTKTTAEKLSILAYFRHSSHFLVLDLSPCKKQVDKLYSKGSVRIASGVELISWERERARDATQRSSAGKNRGTKRGVGWKGGASKHRAINLISPGS